MISLSSLILAVTLLGLSWFVARGDAQSARSRSVALAWGVLAASLVFLVWGPATSFDVVGMELRWQRESWFTSISPALAIVTVLIVSLAPLRTHPPETLAAILRLMACAHGFAATDNEWVFLVLWAASAVIAYRELARTTSSTSLGAIAFRRYHTISVWAAAVGVAAHAFGASTLGFAAWALAFAIRESIVPLHGWFPAAVTRAPLGLLVAFIAPQSGVVVHLCVSNGFSGSWMAYALASLGAATAVVGAVLGLVQKNARSAAAWLLISQTGLIAFGLENSSIEGMMGAFLSWQAMAVGSTGFIMTLAALDARRGTLDLASAAGSFGRTPRMATAFLLMGFSSVGLPLSLGFVAEDLLLQGSIDEFPAFGAVLVVATALNGINVLRCFFALFSGTAKHSGEMDLTPREIVAVSTAVIVLLLGGVLPGILVELATAKG